MNAALDPSINAALDPSINAALDPPINAAQDPPINAALDPQRCAAQADQRCAGPDCPFRFCRCNNGCEPRASPTIGVGDRSISVASEPTRSSRLGTTSSKIKTTLDCDQRSECCTL